jgi:hypothetical protein
MQYVLGRGSEPAAHVPGKQRNLTSFGAIADEKLPLPSIPTRVSTPKVYPIWFAKTFAASCNFLKKTTNF